MKIFLLILSFTLTCSLECENMAESDESKASEVGQEEESCPNHDLLRAQCVDSRMCTSAPATQTDSSSDLFLKIQAYTKHLFKDVTKTPPVGRPGELFVHGENTVPILAPRDNKVMMTVSDMGDGKLMFITAEALTRGLASKPTKKPKLKLHPLQQNIKTFLVPDENDPNKIKAMKLRDVDDFESLDRSTSFVYSNDFSKILSKSDEILEYVKSGGGFLIALRPWFWMENHSGDVEYHGFLNKIGVAFGTSKLFWGQNGFTVPAGNDDTMNQCCEKLLGLHIGHVMKSCCDGNMTIMTSQVIDKWLEALPDYANRAIEENIQELFEHCKKVLDGHYPTLRNKIKGEEKLAAAAMLNRLSLRGYGYQKMPGINMFPFEIAGADNLIECAEVEIDSKRNRAHSTGFYLPAGVQLTIQVVGYDDVTISDKTEKSSVDMSKSKWRVRIGAHSDRLYKKTSLARWPEVIMISHLTSSTLKIQSPFGGLIYFVSPNEPSKIKLRLNNVVEAPYFNLNDPTNVANWDKRRKAPGPWADIEGKYIRFTFPSNCIRTMPDIEQVINKWDEVVAANHDLRGTIVTSQKGEWVVADVQISAGGLHSGYPIMGTLNMTQGKGFILGYEKLTTVGFWGVFHELGHNMQRAMWTFNGTGEVTCNIFSLYASDVISGQQVRENYRLFDEKALRRLFQYLESTTPFADQQNGPWIGLGFYAHLIITFGWDAFKTTFRAYEAIPDAKRPKTNQTKIDTWLLTFSDQVQVNIAPIMTLWKMGASDVTKPDNLPKDCAINENDLERLCSLKPFLPNDLFTQAVRERVKEIEQQYKGLIRSLGDK